MPIARNASVELYYERFGDPARPTLLLISGLSAQCISYPEGLCEMFVERGYQVVRFDNRDVGLSSKLYGVDYELADMASDAAAVLDEVTEAPAHLLGASLGGMIAQLLAIHHCGRVRSLTSLMSRTGEPGFGAPTEAALAVAMAPQVADRAGYIEQHLAALRVYGSTPEWRNEDRLRLELGTRFDRCFCPEGAARQVAALLRARSRDDALRQVDLPTLVMHGSVDQLITPDGGRHTADVIPNSRYVEVGGLGHELSEAAWPVLVSTWADFAATC